jgi:hypothetical protein
MKKPGKARVLLGKIKEDLFLLVAVAATGFSAPFELALDPNSNGRAEKCNQEWYPNTKQSAINARYHNQSLEMFATNKINNATPMQICPATSLSAAIQITSANTRAIVTKIKNSAFILSSVEFLPHRRSKRHSPPVY